MDSRTNEEVNNVSTAFPHVGNMRTREDWLRLVIHSGQVTRIGQHLALVIYHLADTETNIAKLSARDLERITGWGRTAIIKHLNELDEFIRVTWGLGRAKSIFELQGVIAEVMQQKKAERDAASKADETGSVREDDATGDTTEATKEAATPSVHQTDAETATNGSVLPNGRLCVHETDTSVQKSPVGGTIGGEKDPNTQTHTPRVAPDWMISEDGGFEGKVFELTGAEVGSLREVYQYLEFPADLVSTDQFFAKEFDRKGVSPSTQDRLAGLHMYLAKQNRNTRELRLKLGMIEGKGERKPAVPVAPEEPPSCWFDNDARLQVANGFAVELLETVGGDKIRLREELDKAAGWVGVNTRGPQLVAKVRSRLTEQVKGGRSSAKETPAAKRERISQWAKEAEEKFRAKPKEWTA